MRLTGVTFREWLYQYIRLMERVRDGEEIEDWRLSELLTEEAESPTTRT